MRLCPKCGIHDIIPRNAGASCCLVCEPRPTNQKWIGAYSFVAVTLAVAAYILKGIAQ